jgi:hypothetical protein
MPPAEHEVKAPKEAINAGSRPYRSHKVRACDHCRKRKSRCTVDIPGQSCLLCRVQGADCHYQEDTVPDIETSKDDSNQPLSASRGTGQKRKRASEMKSMSNGETADLSSEKGIQQPSTVAPRGERRSDYRFRTSADPQNESVLIVGPVAAEDAQVIEKFMPLEKSTKSPEKGNKPYNVYSNDPRKPILYTRVSRRRQGVRVGSPPGESQKEILEQILGPFKHDLVKLLVLFFFFLPSLTAHI